MYMKEEATTKINTLSLHDALPIYIRNVGRAEEGRDVFNETLAFAHGCVRVKGVTSGEHTSELQSLAYLVCRLLLEKEKTTNRSWNEMIDEFTTVTQSTALLFTSFD